MTMWGLTKPTPWYAWRLLHYWQAGVLRLWIPFYEESGTAAHDVSKYGNNGTMYSGTTPTNLFNSGGKIGYGASFDGVDDYVEVPYSASLDNFDALTVECWIKPSVWADGVFRIFIDKGWASVGGFVLYFHSTVAGLLYFATRDSVSTKNTYYTCPSLNQWYHVAGVFSKGQPNKVYVNGVKGTDSPATADETLTLNSAVKIGKSANDFQGIVDEVRIYNRALTAQEIRALYLITNV